MSLILVVTAFLGFNSLTGSESIQTSINSQVSNTPLVEADAPVATSTDVVQAPAPVATKAAEPTVQERIADLEFDKDRKSHV